MFNQGEITLKAPTEGLAQFIHGAELIVGSLCNSATKESPVTIQQVRSGLQWLVDKAFEYTLAWVSIFSDRNLNITVHHMVYRTIHFIRGIGSRHSTKLQGRCARELYALVDPTRDGDAPPMHNPTSMAPFDSSALPQNSYTAQVNVERLRHCLEGMVDL